MKSFITAFLFVVFAVVAPAESRFWRNANGKFPPNTDARSAVAGFGGWLVVTPDSDWQSKWLTSPNTVPRISETKTVARGKHIFVLSFFSNPKLTQKGLADVTCDVEVVRPDGIVAVRQSNAVCFRGKLAGPVTNIYLSSAVLNFIGDPNDPAGRWLVRTTLKDNVRHVALPLKTSFTLVDKGPNQTMKPTPKGFASRLAPLRNAFSMFATTPCRGLSLSR